MRENARMGAWVRRHERALMSGLLMAGFVLDYATFRALDIRTTFIGLGIYALIASGGIVYVHVFDARGASKSPVLQRIRLVCPLATQLSVGALLSMSLQFYWFSGAFSVSWPVFVALLALIVLNESFRHAYVRPTMQMAVLCFVLTSYFSQLFPYLFGSLAPWTFIVGALVALVLCALLILLIERLAHGTKLLHWRMGAAVCSVFVGMNALFLLDLVPPVPLSLREAGIYHDVHRAADGYALEGEPESFFDRLWPGQVVHQDADGRLYAFTAVYSPARLDTTIFHAWQFHDPSTGRWVTKSRGSFSLRGGRPDGYRGYTYTNAVAPGEWRVSVETARGQVLGRIPFTYE